MVGRGSETCLCRRVKECISPDMRGMEVRIIPPYKYKYKSGLVSDGTPLVHA